MTNALEGLEEATGPFKCPFCSGTFSVSNPEDMNKSPAILHTFPTCPKYDAIQTLDDAIQFMKCAHN
jgi:hypothetical protein